MEKDLSPWICIGKTGTFTDSNGNNYTFYQEDFDTLIKNYNPKEQEAPLCLGHPQTHDPAYGWVQSLKREANKLFARFAYVADTIKERVVKGSYKYVSMAITADKKRLLHVGLLGASAPAMSGLGAVEFSAEQNGILTFSTEIQTLGENMDLAELQKEIGRLSAELKALQEQNAMLTEKLTQSNTAKEESSKKLEESEKKSTETLAEFTAYKGKIEEEKRTQRVNALIEAGKLDPAKKADTLTFATSLALMPQMVKASKNDGTLEEVSAEERYFRELESREQDSRFATFSAPTMGKTQQTQSFSAAELAAKM